MLIRNTDVPAAAKPQRSGPRGDGCSHLRLQEPWVPPDPSQRFWVHPENKLETPDMDMEGQTWYSNGSWGEGFPGKVFWEDGRAIEAPCIKTRLEEKVNPAGRGHLPSEGLLKTKPSAPSDTFLVEAGLCQIQAVFHCTWQGNSQLVWGRTTPSNSSFPTQLEFQSPARDNHRLP